MAISVVESFKIDLNAAAGAQTVATLTNNALADDLILLVAGSSSTSATALSAVSGAGATWYDVSQNVEYSAVGAESTAGGFYIYVGRNGSTNGAIAITQSSFRGTVWVYHLRSSVSGATVSVIPDQVRYVAVTGGSSITKSVRSGDKVFGGYANVAQTGTPTLTSTSAFDAAATGQDGTFVETYLGMRSVTATEAFAVTMSSGAARTGSMLVMQVTDSPVQERSIIGYTRAVSNSSSTVAIPAADTAFLARDVMLVAASYSRSTNDINFTVSGLGATWDLVSTSLINDPTSGQIEMKVYAGRGMTSVGNISITPSGGFNGQVQKVLVRGAASTSVVVNDTRSTTTQLSLTGPTFDTAGDHEIVVGLAALLGSSTGGIAYPASPPTPSTGWRLWNGTSNVYGSARMATRFPSAETHQTTVANTSNKYLWLTQMRVGVVTSVSGATDSFNRADGTLATQSLDTGQQWLAGAYGNPASMSIISNQLGTVSGSNSYNVIETGSSDGTVGATRANTENWLTLIACESAAGLYRVEWGNSGNIYLERDSSANVLATGLSAQTAGKVMTLTAETVSGPGTQLTVKVDGVTVLTYTDTSASRRTGTRFGLGISGNTAARWDSFTFDSIIPATTATGSISLAGSASSQVPGAATGSLSLSGSASSSVETTSTGVLSLTAALPARADAGATASLSLSGVAFAADADVPTAVLSGVLQRKTGSLLLTAFTNTELSGVLQRKTGAFQIFPVADLALQGTRQRRTSAFTVDLGSAPAEVALAGYRLRRTAAFTMRQYAATLNLAATRQRRTAFFGVDVSNDSPDTIANTANIIRWTFRDMSTGEVVRVPINPREMTSPTVSRNMTWAWGAAPGAVMRGIDLTNDQPGEWSFTGVLLTKSHYDLLLDWTRRLTTVQITDHLERTFETIIQKFDPVERLPTATREWRADYTMNCLFLRRVA